MLELLHEIKGTLRRNMMRTIATGFAVVSGLFLLIVLQGAGNGVIHSFQYNMGGFAFDAVHVFGGRTTKPWEGIKEGRFIRLDDRDLEMSRRHFPNQIISAIPTLNQHGVVASYGAHYINGTSMVGVYPEYAASQAVEILEGRFINIMDMMEKRKVCVVGSNSCKDLFKEGGSPIGRNVKLGGILYTVVGEYKTNEMSNGSSFYVPYTTLCTIYNRGRFIDELTMNTQNIPTDSAMEQFMKEYTRATSYIHSFDPTDDRALWIWNQAGDNIQMNRAMSILNKAFWILGLLTLLSGVVSVSNIMLISVKERTREFGIRRAIGARPWNIISMVVLESVVITAIFGYIGMLLGIFFCEWMNATVGNQVMDLGVFQAKYFVDPTVDLHVCFQATIVIIIAGALAGFFPARKAVKVKTIDALRA
ncbi:MAG: ABC transporter permease [Bacteroidaceae bacterium]|nr:ABC transporter permease [Bacteroidaceae bacterium]